MPLFDVAFGTEIDTVITPNFTVARIIVHKNSVTELSPTILECGPSFAAIGASGTGSFIERGKVKNILNGKPDGSVRLRGRWNGSPIDMEGGTLNQWYKKLAAEYKETGVIPDVDITTDKKHVSYSLSPRGQYKKEKWYHYVVELDAKEAHFIDTSKLGENISIFSIDDNDITVNGKNFDKVSFINVLPTTNHVTVISNVKDSVILVIFRNPALDSLSVEELWEKHGYVICKSIG